VKREKTEKDRRCILIYVSEKVVQNEIRAKRDKNLPYKWKQ
jgi:hypothetical protein